MSSDNSSWIHETRVTLQSADVDFYQLNPARYWFDFLSTLVLAFGLSSTYMMMPLGSWQQLAAFPFAVFFMYRLSSLVHEVTHLGQGEMRAYKMTWNLLVGVMTLTPSAFYSRHHRDHHTVRYYGTPVDAEYVANICPGGSWRSILIFVFEILVMPLVVFLRFLLAPLTFLNPHWRRFILRRASSLTMNWRYQRNVSESERREITVFEMLCFVRALFIPLGVLAGVHPWTRIPLVYVLAVCILALNQIRLLADHHLNSDGNKLNFEDHILDSCNFVERDLLTSFFFPFAIRYHALHHIFPTMPYHNLAAAHDHLSRHLPADSPYHSLSQPSWWSVAKNAFRGDKTRTDLSPALPSMTPARG